jgi:glycerophosphoryl diester phosphodiesterase
VLVIAHRGASGHLPENTLPAYELAIEMRADMIEIDLHRTRDGAIVIAHDADLAGLGQIGDATVQEVRALDAGGGEKIPLLDEVLEGFGDRIPFNLEIKWGAAGDYPGLEAEVLAALSQRGLAETILFSSFRDSILARLREQDPQARLALLVSPRGRNFTVAGAIDRARRLGAEALNPHLSQADPALVGAAHAAGLAVNVYTVDREDDMRRLREAGVDGLFTNHPGRLRALLNDEMGAEGGAERGAAGGAEGAT